MLNKKYNPNLRMIPESTNKNKGFTIIEVIFAIFVLLIGILASYTVTQQIISYTSIANSRLVAAYLAQEGIEIVRNIRDTNWLTVPQVAWNYGLTGCTTGCEVDYDENSLSAWVDPGRYLNIENTNGFYGYDVGTQPKYKRKITIDGSVNDILKVSVEVNWTEKGKDYTVTAQENLYNWYPSP